MDISCAFATAPATPEHIVLAEQLGYRRAWCYDSPALYTDVWVALALAAERTSRIGLGPAVLVPSLRHPMTNAAAIATLCDLAPGRLAVAVGAGFTGRYVLGRPPMRWADVAAYVRVLRALLRGEDAEWEGSMIRMIHPDGFGPRRPIDVPVLIASDGPKGAAVAAELGDGLFLAARFDVPSPPPEWVARLLFGTVLDDGESGDSPRAIEAAGHGAAVVYHAVYERGGAAVDGVPGGATWRAAAEAVPAEVRHLAVHEGHLVAPNERDRAALADAPGFIEAFSFTGLAAALRDRLDEMAAAGITEVAYQPAGPDIARELEAFATMAGLVRGVSG